MKGLRKGCVWVGDGTDCNILTPSSSDDSSTSFSFYWAAQPGSLGPKSSFWSWFSLPLTATRTATQTPTNWPNWLTPTLSSRLWNPVTWLFDIHLLPMASQLHRIQPIHGQSDTLLSSTGCTCIYIGASLNWQLGQGLICYNRISVLQNLVIANS